MRSQFRISLWIVLLALLISACQPAVETPAPDAGLPVASTSEPSAPTPTPEPRALTICLGQEPNSLYLYGAPNTAARSVLAAIYDGPVDSIEYQPRAVILEKVPSLVDGDAQIAPVAVRTGDEVVAADGLPITLDAGVRVRPAGCRDDGCAVVYDGEAPLEMDQLVVTFRLLPGLLWSDGAPLTAYDSVFSYTIARRTQVPVTRYLVDRTRSYEAADDLTVQWWGKPGYLDPDFAYNFVSPLPQHLLAEIPLADLPAADAAARIPVGWGPYLLLDWQPGGPLTLTRNPLYFRADEGLPRFDTLTFKVVAGADAALTELLAGGCDVVDTSVRLDEQVGLLVELQRTAQVQALFSPTMTIERLDFGIWPASYDNGYTPGPGSDRPDLLGDPRTRQAIAMCIDRQLLVSKVLYGRSVVPDTFLPVGHPLADPQGLSYGYDPAAAVQLLEQIGWRDSDANPDTPRTAWDIPGVPLTTPLVLTYVTTGAAQRRLISELIASMLKNCGIGLELTYLTPEELYAPGPNGPLFGRQFDLAQFSMGVSGPSPTCEWWTSDQIPDDANLWIGTNLGGYRSAAFDSACRAAMTSLPGEPGRDQVYAAVQAVFLQDLPSLPLYQRLKVVAARADLCGLRLDPAPLTDQWNLESYGLGNECEP